jgi:hypothetical protein
MKMGNKEARIYMLSVDQLVKVMIEYIIKYQEQKSEMHQLYDLNSEEITKYAQDAFEKILKDYDLIEITKEKRPNGVFFH